MKIILVKMATKVRLFPYSPKSLLQKLASKCIIFCGFFSYFVEKNTSSVHSVENYIRRHTSICLYSQSRHHCSITSRWEDEGGKCLNLTKAEVFNPSGCNFGIRIRCMPVREHVYDVKVNHRLPFCNASRRCAAVQSGL